MKLQRTALTSASRRASSVWSLSLPSCIIVSSRCADKYLFSSVAILSSWSSFWAFDYTRHHKKMILHSAYVHLVWKNGNRNILEINSNTLAVFHTSGGHSWGVMNSGVSLQQLNGHMHSMSWHATYSSPEKCCSFSNIIRERRYSGNSCIKFTSGSKNALLYSPE